MRLHGQFYRSGRRKRTRRNGYGGDRIALFGLDSKSLAEQDDAGRAGIKSSATHVCKQGQNINQTRSAIDRRRLEDSTMGFARGGIDDSMFGSEYVVLRMPDARGRGFRNNLLGTRPAKTGTDVGDNHNERNTCNAFCVAKVFSDLAKVRVSPNILGSIDGLRWHQDQHHGGWFYYIHVCTVDANR